MTSLSNNYPVEFFAAEGNVDSRKLFSIRFLPIMLRKLIRRTNFAVQRELR